MFNYEGSKGSSLGLIKPLSLLILSVAVLPCLCGFPLNWGVLGYLLLYIRVGTRKRSDRLGGRRSRRLGHVSGRIFGGRRPAHFSHRATDAGLGSARYLNSGWNTRREWVGSLDILTAVHRVRRGEDDVSAPYYHTVGREVYIYGSYDLQFR